MPGINEGLFAGRSGIQAHGSAISVLADNIANSNTIGFKTQRADFSDLLAGNLGGGGAGSVQVGSGSEVRSTTPLLTQGAFEMTGRGLDLAIDGNGFFIVEGTTGRVFSRAGNFQVDDSGYLVNQIGYRVMGFPADGSGGLEQLNINNFSQTSVRTDIVSVSGNLDASAAETLPAAIPEPAAAFSDLANAAQFSTFVDVFDSLGASHTVTMFFFHTDAAAREWEVRAYVDGGEVTGGTAGVPTLVGPGTPAVTPAQLVFDDQGVLTTPLSFSINPGWNNGSDTSAAAEIDISFPNFTQFSSGSGISSITQDGKGAGNIVSFNVSEDGDLFALFDNGQSSTIGTIALATFASPETLRRLGGSLYAESTVSGEPVVGRARSGQFGGINSGALELSNADIANDFVKLISLQRGFQGSSRIITSINDLLNEIINLAR